MKKSTWFIIWILPALVLAQKENLKPTLIDNTDRTGWLYVSPAEQPGIRVTSIYSPSGNWPGWYLKMK